MLLDHVNAQPHDRGEDQHTDDDLFEHADTYSDRGQFRGARTLY